jgi:hypothetical protein
LMFRSVNGTAEYYGWHLHDLSADRTMPPALSRGECQEKSLRAIQEALNEPEAAW